MRLTLTFSHFEEIINNGFDLNAIFLLKMILEDIDVETLCQSSEKLSALYNSLTRKGLISDEKNLTLLGHEVLAFLDKKKSPDSKLARKKDITNEFKLWWKSYPGTDTFSYKGKSFKGTRSMRVKEADCKIALYKILEEGEYTIDQLIAALKFETEQKMQNSVKENSNKLKYMQNSLTYLNQRTFEPYIELLGQNIEFNQESVVDSTDI